MCTLLAHSTTNTLQKYTFFQYPTIAKSRYFGRLLYVADLNQVLTDLYGIEGSTLANLVATEPEGQAVLVREVFAHATNEDVVLAGSLQRHGVHEVSGVVDQRTARSCSDSLLCLFDADGALGLYPHAL